MLQKIKEWWLIAFLALAAIPFISQYRSLDFSLENIWILVLPFSFYIADNSQKSWRFLPISILAFGMHFAIDSPFFLFMAWCLALMWLVEIQFGKLNGTVLLIILLASPLSDYIFKVFGFPIRIYLSSVSTYLLALIDSGFSASGNIISKGSKIYTVDEACSGLKMVISSFIIALFFLSHFERKQAVKLKFHIVLALLTIVSGLILFANVMRIVALVLLQFPPETFGHELVGILSFLLLILVPIYFIIPKLLKHFGTIKMNANTSSDTLQYKPIHQWLGIGLTFVLAIYMLQYQLHTKQASTINNQLELAHFSKQYLDNGVCQLQSQDANIFIKANKGWYRSDHHPGVCWIGSGWQISSSQPIEINGNSVFVSTLKKGNQTQYMTWWYESKSLKTTSQLAWRWQALKSNEDFLLVNISSANKDQLYTLTQKVLTEGLYE